MHVYQICNVQGVKTLDYVVVVSAPVGRDILRTTFNVIQRMFLRLGDVFCIPNAEKWKTHNQIIDV